MLPSATERVPSPLPSFPPPAPNIAPLSPAIAYTVLLSHPIHPLFSGTISPVPLVPTRNFCALAMPSSPIPMVHTTRLLAPSSSGKLQCQHQVTSDATLLHHYAPLPRPFNLQGDDASIAHMSCIGCGFFRLTFVN